MKSNQVIVLRKHKYSESDLILRCLDSEGQKISFFARGALKSQKRFSGGILEVAHHLLVFYPDKLPPKESSLFPLQEAKLLNDFSFLRKNYEKLNLSLYFLQILDQVSFEETQDSQALYLLLGNALKTLEHSQNLKILSLQFHIKLLFYLGMYYPDQRTEVFLKNPIHLHEQIEVDAQDFLLLSEEMMERLHQLNLLIHSLPHQSFLGLSGNSSCLPAL